MPPFHRKKKKNNVGEILTKLNKKKERIFCCSKTQKKKTTTTTPFPNPLSFQFTSLFPPFFKQTATCECDHTFSRNKKKERVWCLCVFFPTSFRISMPTHSYQWWFFLSCWGKAKDNSRPDLHENTYTLFRQNPAYKFFLRRFVWVADFSITYQTLQKQERILFLHFFFGFNFF